MTETTPTTPAQELRAAAAKLRETAAKATPGPWAFHPELYRDRGGIMSESPQAMGWAALVIDVHSTSEHANAGWMALVSTALAEPLAAWLEETARQYDLPPCDDPTGVCNRCEWDPTMLIALPVARAITGGGP